MPHLTFHQVADFTAYWGFFWNLVYVLSPPREYFHSPRYDRYLDLVSYYGGLNIRSLIMRVYQAQPSQAPPPPKRPDTPAIVTKENDGSGPEH